MTATLIYTGTPALHRPGNATDERAARLAGGLDALGVGDGDVVAVMLANHPVAIDLIRASRIVGSYYCAINFHFKADEAGFVLNDCGAKVLIVGAEWLPMIEPRIAPHVRVLVVDGAASAQDFETWLAAQPPYAGPLRNPRAHMPYTSGTTGRPKGVRRLAVALADAPRQQQMSRDLAAAALGLKPGIRALLSAPLYHSGPAVFAQQSMELGELLVLQPRFDAEATLAAIEQHRIDTLYLVPIMYVRLLRLPDAVKSRYDLSSVRYVGSTGSPCAPEVKRAMLDWWGDVIYETYGASEAGLITVLDPALARRKPGCAGRPFGAQVRILREDGTECVTGEPGVVYVRQPAYPDFEYVNQPQARQAIDRGGLVTMGDIGYLDAEGDLFLCDRASDMVISGGVNIYPAEIEHELFALPGVADCAVFGIPDEEYGESLIALIEPRHEPHAPLEASAVRDWLGQRLAGYKVPRRVEFMAELPRDDNGKVAKRRLREAWWARSGRKI